MSTPPPWDSRHGLTEEDVRKQNRAVLDAVLASAASEPPGVRESLHVHATELMSWADNLLVNGWPRFPYSPDWADVDGALLPDPMRLGATLQLKLTGIHSYETRRIVAQEQTTLGWLSTVFLHSVAMERPDGALLLYETVLFRGSKNSLEHDAPIACWRYPSRRAAEEGHRRVADAIAEGGSAERLPGEARQPTLTEAFDLLCALIPSDEDGV